MYKVFVAVKQIAAFSEIVDIDQIVRHKIQELERCGALYRLEVHGDDYTTIYIINITEIVKAPASE